MLLRLSINPETVKIKNNKERKTVFAPAFSATGEQKHILQNIFITPDFDLLRKLLPTVPMYADGRSFLVFRAFSAVCQRVKKEFFDTLGQHRNYAVLP